MATPYMRLENWPQALSIERVWALLHNAGVPVKRCPKTFGSHRSAFNIKFETTRGQVIFGISTHSSTRARRSERRPHGFVMGPPRAIPGALEMLSIYVRTDPGLAVTRPSSSRASAGARPTRRMSTDGC